MLPTGEAYLHNFLSDDIDFHQLHSAWGQVTNLQFYLLFITRLVEKEKPSRSCYLMSWNPPSLTTTDPFI